MFTIIAAFQFESSNCATPTKNELGRKFTGKFRANQPESMRPGMTYHSNNSTVIGKEVKFCMWQPWFNRDLEHV